jgi:hypothetical protein
MKRKWILAILLVTGLAWQPARPVFASFQEAGLALRQLGEVDSLLQVEPTAQPPGAGEAPETALPTLDDVPIETPTPEPTANQLPPTATLPAPTPTEPQATATQPAPTATQLPPSATPSPTPPPLLSLASSEPADATSGQAGSLTVWGSGFQPGMVVRLVGYGLLDTTYVNSGLASAGLPASLPAGKYSIQVVLLDGRSAALDQAITIHAQAAPPAAAPTPDSRQPALVVCSSATDPAKIRPGDEFMLYVEICNAGGLASTAGMVSFGGPSFALVGDKVHYLGEINPGGAVGLSQRLRVPVSAVPGISLVEISMDANDMYGGYYSFKGSTGVEVAEPAVSTGGGAGEPSRLVVVSSEIVPPIIHPGEAFELVLKVRNLGSAAASKTTFSVTPSEAAAHPGGAGYFMFETLSAGDEVVVRLPLLARLQASPGYYNLEVNLESGSGAASFSYQQIVGMEISADLGSRPCLVISSFQVEPAKLYPGDSLELVMVVQNVGGGSARQVAVTLGGDNPEGLKPFAPLGSGNVKFIPALAAGENAEIRIALLVDGRAEARAFNTPVGLSYWDDNNVQYNEIQVISLAVYNKPLFKASFFKDVFPGLVGQPMRLPVEFSNLSINRFNISTIRIYSDDLEISGGEAFVGRLDGGGLFSLEPTGIPKRDGHLKLNVVVEYLDDYNQIQTWSDELEVEARPGMATSKPAEQLVAEDLPQKEGFWAALLRFIRGFLGLGS